ncbi:MBL fold metallo-hydrolase [Amantichitinum ursilacus]|uniref:MBL fold metallo-hydrolase n=1 Tax=Amantichitinum ursilacus TaxID=857265 RepID=UPI001F32BD8C|nr:MBL fold metallo-hydrolase [Amantichitinum ursilacus]
MAAVCYCLIAALPILAAPPAQAAAPQVRTQAPGFYRMMLGDFEITALSDGTHAFPIDSALQNTSASEVARDLAQAELTQPVQGSINAFLINTGSKLILIDTGAGALYGPCCGRLLAHLRAAGYQPAQVDEILLTHLHKDHVGGVLAQGVAAFPNAILRVAAPEAAYWLDVSHKASAPDFLGSFFDSAIAAVAPYRAAGHYQPINANGPLEPGISVQLEPGHTPGHATYRIESRGKVLLVWGDIIHVAAIQLQNPQVSVEYDNDAVAARAARVRLLQQSASQHVLVAAAHIAFPGLGHVQAAADGTWRWLPINYEGDPIAH